LRWRKPGFPAENTLAAFDYAVASGCDGFEFDVRFTRDRRSVLSHDTKLNRREVASTEYAGLERRGAGNLPCLEDVLARYDAETYLDIELKVAGNEESVVAALQANPPQGGYVVSSFLPEVVVRLHELDPALPLGYICEHQDDVARWPDLPVTTFLPHHALVSQRLIDDLHRRNMELLTWTVNDVEKMECLAGWGVDGLISDAPRLLASTFSVPRRLSPQPSTE
jgi:glycerophosphoryl diester phosphodiesterase